MRLGQSHDPARGTKTPWDAQAVKAKDQMSALGPNSSQCQRAREWPLFALTGRLESTDTVLYWVKGGSFFRISTLSGACVLCVLVRH